MCSYIKNLDPNIIIDIALLPATTSDIHIQIWPPIVYNNTLHK